MTNSDVIELFINYISAQRRYSPLTVRNYRHDIEEFVRWSLEYELWCKMEFFGEEIENQESAASGVKKRGPQNLLDLLPMVFTREEARLMRQRQGIVRGSVKMMLDNWKKRGYIELYGEEMPQQEIARQRYIKTEEYLKKHPQQQV